LNKSDEFTILLKEYFNLMHCFIQHKEVPSMNVNSPTFQLANQVGKQLEAAQLSLTTAESCTGGLVAAAVTSVEGSGNWFDRGFVTYSIPSKTEMLGVSAALIQRHGAVSEPVAQAMAEGALHNSRANIALAVTGLAGPGDGGEDKSVGTVCFAWCSTDQRRCETMKFNGEPWQVRTQAAEYALRGVVTLVDKRGN